jgi:hypothetical protein
MILGFSKMSDYLWFSLARKGIVPGLLHPSKHPKFSTCIPGG